MDGVPGPYDLVYRDTSGCTQVLHHFPEDGVDRNEQRWICREESFHGAVSSCSAGLTSHRIIGSDLEVIPVSAHQFGDPSMGIRDHGFKDRTIGVRHPLGGFRTVQIGLIFQASI